VRRRAAVEAGLAVAGSRTWRRSVSSSTGRISTSAAGRRSGPAGSTTSRRATRRSPWWWTTSRPWTPWTL